MATLGELLLGLRNGIFVSRPGSEKTSRPILRISAVRPMDLRNDDVRYVPESAEVSNADDWYVQKDDLLFTRYSGNPEFVAACARVRTELPNTLYPDKLIRGRVIPGLVDPGYLEAMVSAPQSRAVIRGLIKTTAGQVGISGRDIRSIPIPLAPYVEQVRIAATIEEQFSRLDAGNSSLRRAERNLKRARVAILDAAISGKLLGIRRYPWEELALGDLVDDIHAGKSFKCEERPSNLDEWGVVKVSAMTWGRFKEGENKTVVDHRRIDSRFEIGPGDLLVSRANTVEYVGAAVLVGKCRPRLLLSDKSLRLIPNSKALPEWLLISLRSSSARRYIESVASGTSDSMRNISQPNLKALRIATPPIEVQSQIVTEVDRMMSQIEKLDESLVHSLRSVQALRSSILSAAFSGELP
jgi:type I restriction enzyme, S subunit